MIPSPNIAPAAARPKPTWPAARRCLPLVMAGMTWLSSSGCKNPGVIRSDETLTRLRAGQTFTAPADGWYMSDALYLRYRQAVADRILELQTR